MLRQRLAICFCLSLALGIPGLAQGETLDGQVTKAQEPPAAQTANSQYAWAVDDTIDPTTHRRHAEGFLVQHPSADSDAELQVRATCYGVGMSWLIVYVSGTKPAIGYKQNYPAGTRGGGGPVIAYGVAAIPVLVVEAGIAAARTQSPWVDMLVTIDNGKPERFSSRMPYLNAATLSFTRMDAPKDRMPAGLQVLGGVEDGPVASFSEIVKAQIIRVALELEDGTIVHLKVKPQEPGFQRLLQSCGVATVAHPMPAKPSTDDDDDPGMAFALRAAHGDVPPATSNAKDVFSIQGDTVTDETIGLMWARKDSGHGMPWQDGKQYCATLATGGFNDWRLPEISELKTLYDPKGKQTAAGGYLARIRPEFSLTRYSVWSNTKGRDIAMPDWDPHGPLHTMQTFNFFNGSPADDYLDMSKQSEETKTQFSVLCVRSSK